MSYSVSSCNPLSSVLVVEDVVCTVEPLLGTAVTVYAVTGAPLAGTTGGVHVTVMDEPEVAMAVTPPGGGGTGQGRRKPEWDVLEQLYTVKSSVPYHNDINFHSIIEHLYLTPHDTTTHCHITCKERAFTSEDDRHWATGSGWNRLVQGRHTYSECPLQPF